jgi:hydrogenase maturation protease
MRGDERLSVLVAAIGNSDRGDDGVGPAIANRLRNRVPAGVRLVESRGDVLELIDEWAGTSAVILVDASNPAGEAGRIRRLDLVAEPLPADFSQNSTHAFGLAETVELARALGRLPSRVVIYIVEGAQFEVGAPLSPPVAEAVERGADAILVELSKIAGGKPDRGVSEHA